MICVEGLTRRYGDFLAIDNVSFEIEQGEIVGLLGHNGAGKTTLMKIITGYLEPDMGTVVIDGLDMALSRRAVQQSMGYLPENCPVYPEMTVIDYLRYSAKLHGIASENVDNAVYQAVVRTALLEKATAMIATLSRGLRQRVGVAQAILHEPKILILDEPTNGLDPSQIHHMRDLIKTLAEKSTVIISTHILQEVQAVCDRAIIIRHGLKVLDARLSELCQVNCLLLEVNATLEVFTSLAKQLESIKAVSLLREEPACSRYRLTLNEGIDVRSVTAEISRLVHQQGLALYLIQPEVRDLETVFGEINAEKIEGGETQQ